MADESMNTNELTYEEKAEKCTVVSKPMATKKLGKRLFKLIRKSTKQKNYIRSGLKLVQAKIKRGEKGLVILAGNVHPIDVACHLPIVCEDRNIPYIFVPTGRDIGMAMGVKRSSLVAMVIKHESYQELFDECYEEVKAIPPPETLA